MYKSWMKLSTDAWLLGLEASSVIGQRTMMMAMGAPGAQEEAARMISEKIDSTMALQMRAMTGGLGATPQGAATQIVAHYRKKVRANRRRLAKG
jgi:hypothetical protein